MPSQSPQYAPNDLSRGDYWARKIPADTLRRYALGLFLVSLTSLFIAGVVGFLVLRYVSPEAEKRAPIRVPALLWWSTAALLAAGVAMTRARQAAKDGRVDQVRLRLPFAWLLTLVFLAIQTPGMIQLLRAYRQSYAGYPPGLEGVVFALVLLHALHVIGGMVPLTALCLRCLRHRLGPANLGAVQSCTGYWHFLEAVWLSLFLTFWFAS